jgi:hypothetical protein
MAAWATVDAVNPDEALAAARDLDTREWDYDTSTAELDFNVTPAVELVRE